MCELVDCITGLRWHTRTDGATRTQWRSGRLMLLYLALLLNQQYSMFYHIYHATYTIWSRYLHYMITLPTLYDHATYTMITLPTLWSRYLHYMITLPTVWSRYLQYDHATYTIWYVSQFINSLYYKGTYVFIAKLNSNSSYVLNTFQSVITL